MENRQLQLPILTPNVWERMEKSRQNQAVQTMAEMIRQIIRNKERKESDYGIAERSEDHRLTS